MKSCKNQLQLSPSKDLRVLSPCWLIHASIPNEKTVTSMDVDEQIDDDQPGSVPVDSQSESSFTGEDSAIPADPSFTSQVRPRNMFVVGDTVRVDYEPHAHFGKVGTIVRGLEGVTQTHLVYFPPSEVEIEATEQIEVFRLVKIDPVTHLPTDPEVPIGKIGSRVYNIPSTYDVLQPGDKIVTFKGYRGLVASDLLVTVGDKSRIGHYFVILRKLNKYTRSHLWAVPAECLQRYHPGQIGWEFRLSNSTDAPNHPDDYVDLQRQSSTMILESGFAPCSTCGGQRLIDGHANCLLCSSILGLQLHHQDIPDNNHGISRKRRIQANPQASESLLPPNRGESAYREYSIRNLGPFDEVIIRPVSKMPAASNFLRSLKGWIKGRDTRYDEKML